MAQNNLRVIFSDNAEVIFDIILEKYGLTETEEDIQKQIEINIDSRRTTLRKAISEFAKKNILEEEFYNLSEKKLLIKKPDAENLLREIKEKLLPQLLVHPSERFIDPVFREEVSKKAFNESEKNNPPTPYIKNPTIQNVEENAKVSDQTKKFSEETKKIIQNVEERKIPENKPENEKKSSDTYREPIE